MKVKLTEDVELNDSSWNERRFEILKKERPDGRVAVTDDRGQTFIAPIGKLEILTEGKG